MTLTASKTRRAALVLMAVASLAAAAPAFAAAEKLVEAGKIFPYLDAFLKIPAAQRSRVKVGYSLTRDGKPATGIQVWMVSPTGARTPMPITPGGGFDRLPTLAELQGGSKVAFAVDPAVKLGVRMELDSAVKPAQEMDAHEIAASIAESNVVIGKAAGPMALVAPKMAQVVFVGAPSGVAVAGDGKTTTLPTYQGMAVFNPSAMPAAVKVRLANAPRRVALAPAK